ncbi:TetR/AcrR family transcriptional regulator C-terminal domain-containing protein [Archangium primigenium]|uniref:TetR/AcrR family transcriptional regulator C-terminal domain-containing protein n=1 Tax=[Archangium] primigenium TaxID=2792470 RepID=UPI00195D0A9A|nr:TetR/AcrR family transcriptional regulator C-terminal domain-containing protein [Archangium primigenium]MBM7116844.1 TetR/AcrR family transcriptional regulator C-terminal domain-containing protein [Archangium primigenium]
MRIQRERAVQAALALLDEEGIEGVTMRKLAQRLEVQAPSLYWHFASKQALLDGMADALLEDVARGVDPKAPWDAVVRDVTAQLRQALRSRRDGARVFAGTYVVTENVLRVSEAMMGALRRAGASSRVAAWGSFSLVYYVLGFTLEEQGLDPRSNPEASRFHERREHFAAFPPGQFPHVLAALADIFDEDLEARFAFGLERLVTGLRADLSLSA